MLGLFLMTSHKDVDMKKFIFVIHAYKEKLPYEVECNSLDELMHELRTGLLVTNFGRVRDEDVDAILIYEGSLETKPIKCIYH